MTKTKIQPIMKLIKNQKFDWVNSNIREGLFETPKEVSGDFKLFHFDKRLSSEDAIKEMEKEGYSPANAWELLNWKDWNNKDFVVALGSVGEVDGSRHVPVLGRDDSKRCLHLIWWVSGWDACCRFLGVRNSELKTSDTGKIYSVTLGHLESRVSEMERKLAEIWKIISNKLL